MKSQAISDYREVADDVIHLELSFLLAALNDVFNSILMYF